MKISLLPKDIAEKIAAGEVIERPASVVKELVENSIDAEASEIAVILEEGGRNLIQILDNGLGMGKSDLSLCTARHATSKIKTLSDLEKIKTLGFRGEALASIAAVSRLKITSREKGASDAYELLQEDITLSPKLNSVTFGHFQGSKHGTSIRVESLFATMPARLKFLKSERSEISVIRDWLERYSLAYPNTGFKLVSNDRTLLDLRPGSLDERIRNVLCDGESLKIIEQSQTSGKTKATLYWLQGLSLPSSKKIIQVVNQRVLRDRVLQQAVLLPFQQKLLPGHYPALLLFLELPPEEIDVNTHPTKSEVRFENSQMIFQLIRSSIDKMIVTEGMPTQVHSFEPFQSSTPLFQRPYAQHRTSLSFPTIEAASSLKFIGSLFQTYLVFQNGSEVEILDQHAAHERVRYEKLKSALTKKENPEKQALLFPVSVKWDFQESMLSYDSIEAMLAPFGFELERFGENSILFRSLPPHFGSGNLEARLISLLERLQAGESLLDEQVFEKIASEACRSSVMAGDALSESHAYPLYENLMKCAHPWSCPHGRPTVLRLTQTRFEEWFQRLTP